MKITKEQITRDLFEIFGNKVKKNSLKHIVNVIFKLMQNYLEKGDNIEIRNFGVFKTVLSERTVVRLIKDRKTITIPKRKVVRFKISRKLKSIINRNG